MVKIKKIYKCKSFHIHTIVIKSKFYKLIDVDGIFNATSNYLKIKNSLIILNNKIKALLKKRLNNLKFCRQKIKTHFNHLHNAF